jgi:hypothetical protein
MISAADLSDQDFAQWRHHPVSAIFLRFLADQRANWEHGALDLWRAGILHKSPETPELDSDYLRGKCRALAELEQITLSDIKSFYAEATAPDDEEEST